MPGRHEFQAIARVSWQADGGPFDAAFSIWRAGRLIHQEGKIGEYPTRQEAFEAAYWAAVKWKDEHGSEFSV